MCGANGKTESLAQYVHTYCSKHLCIPPFHAMPVFSNRKSHNNTSVHIWKGGRRAVQIDSVYARFCFPSSVPMFLERAKNPVVYETLYIDRRSFCLIKTN